MYHDPIQRKAKNQMTNTYTPYPAYKDSGVEWLGEIPEGWDLWKIIHACSQVGSGTTPKSDSDEYYEGKHLWVTTGELRESTIFDTKKKINDNALSKIPSLRIHPAGSVAIAMYGATIGRLGILGKDATTNQACCVIPPSEILHNKYLFYWLYAMKKDIINLSSGGGQPNINQEKVASLKISAPQIAEQTQIASFLDHETARIDTLIAKQETLIALLKEKRQAVISHAVTKGLNPNVEMKDSGVEWLGEVPAHWNSTRLKFLTDQIVDGAHFTPTYVDEGVPFLRVTDIQKKVIDTKNIKYIPKKEHEELIKRCNPAFGDLLLSKNGTIGVPKIVDWNWDFSIFVSLCLIKLNKRLNVKYAYYFFLSQQIKEQINGQIKQSTVINLHLDKIQSFYLALPPLKEQEEISSYLDQHLNSCDLQVKKAEDMNTLLKERRTALISAAVTGKIDLRDWQAPQGEA